MPNALVTVSDKGKELAEYLTYADGRTLLFPDAIQGRPTSRSSERDQLTVSVERDGFTAKKSIILGETHDPRHHAGRKDDLRQQRAPDVLFLLDSTGSMDDEIQQIKATLQSIAKRVSNLPANPDLRFGMVSYRDRDDSYVTRLHDFDGNVERFQRTIRGVEASGGNDYPESLNQALHEAVNDASWRENSIRLTFLIADARPIWTTSRTRTTRRRWCGPGRRHKDILRGQQRAGRPGRVHLPADRPADDGKLPVHPVPGRPPGKLDTPHSVEQFTINNLDGLIVRLIEMELAGIEGGQKPGMRMK